MKTCTCGHGIDSHERCGRDCGTTGCHDCSCDIRAFEVDQGSIHYQDTGKIVTLVEHLARPVVTPAT